MQQIRDDTIGGFNAFLIAQKAETEPALLTLVQFDSYRPYEIIHDCTPIQEVPELTDDRFMPRGMTPLLDALGQAIQDLEARYPSFPESCSHPRIIVVVITDGKENASRKFTHDQVRQVIQNKQDVNGWQFIFLSADLDAISEAVSLGVRPSAALRFAKTVRGTRAAWEASSELVCHYRTVADGQVGFSSAHRSQQQSEAMRRNEEWGDD
ncbi:MAG: hypothetical protein K9L32_02310 [Chromatiaceae bacterium]|nr:hypothetical protein [Chromatiaceae bacterium]